MREILTFLAVAIPVLGVIPYLRNTISGSTRPNVVTWFTWSLLNGINMAVAFSEGAWQTGLYSMAGFIATALIVLVGLRHGVRKYTRFDVICQTIALLGIPLWLMTGHPELAVLILLCVDFAGGLPTLRHAWKAPHEETWQTLATSGLGGVLILISLTQYGVVALTMPAYILLFDIAVLAIMFSRKRRLAGAFRHVKPLMVLFKRCHTTLF